MNDASRTSASADPDRPVATGRSSRASFARTSATSRVAVSKESDLSVALVERAVNRWERSSI